jgi:DNA helicase-2/ATP-dependent DNA helicase PcrA
MAYEGFCVLARNRYALDPVREELARRAIRTLLYVGPRGLVETEALAGRGALEGPGVRLLTVHAAKGLEFRAIAMIGMNEGTFPDYRSTAGAALVDERRSAYLAMTRASLVLILTRPRARTMPWGATREQAESRFVAEAGLTMKVCR